MYGNLPYYSNAVQEAIYAQHYNSVLRLAQKADDHGRVGVSRPELIHSLGISRTLADGLGLSSVFDTFNYLPRFRNNMGNRDSLLYIIADANRQAINYFKNNERGGLASLVLAGI